MKETEDDRDRIIKEKEEEIVELNHAMTALEHSYKRILDVSNSSRLKLTCILIKVFPSVLTLDFPFFITVDEVSEISLDVIYNFREKKKNFINVCISFFISNCFPHYFLRKTQILNSYICL